MTRFVATLAIALICAPCFSQEKQTAPEKEVIRLKKEVQGTQFKFWKIKDSSVEMATKDDFVKAVEKNAVNRYRNWANTADPFVIVTVLDAKITKLDMGADPWKTGTEEISRVTHMHVVAKSFAGQPATKETFLRLQSRMKAAIELQFSD